jgi:putative phosphoribosyl transferase
MDSARRAHLPSRQGIDSRQMSTPYKNREAAGRELAALLHAHADRKDAIVLALPRGGVAVARAVADELHLPLDVLVVRKLGLPWQPELAAGAIAPGGVRVTNPEIGAYVSDIERVIAPVAEREGRELERREAEYRKGRPPRDIRGQAAILVDDGIATGSTMEAAVLAARAMNARSVIVAVPVAPPDTCERLQHVADELVCPCRPFDFMAVGAWYLDFPQTSDAEVVTLLGQSAAARPGAPGETSPPSTRR